MTLIVILPILVVAVLIALLLLAADPEVGGGRDRRGRNRQDPHVGKW
jgi:hypothetical protein